MGMNKLRRDVNMQVSFASGDAWHGLVPARSLTTWVIKGQGEKVAPDATTDACSRYCSPTACSWNSDYSCPWEDKAGAKGRARNDGSDGFNCCCVNRFSSSQPCGGPQNSSAVEIVV